MHPDANFCNGSGVWQNHPKLLGPGALIFVAKQLWPKLALTGSSSSEASIKPRYTKISKQHSHEGEPRDYNTEHLIHLRVIAAEKEIYYKPGSE